MQYRFLEVEFPLPLIGFSFGFIGVFIILYVAAYFLFKKIKYRLPYFKRVKAILDTYPTEAPKTKSLADLMPPGRKPAQN